jgi:hypothetical protein
VGRKYLGGLRNGQCGWDFWHITSYTLGDKPSAATPTVSLHFARLEDSCMPKSRKPQPPTPPGGSLLQPNTLPRRPDATILGGRRTLHATLEDEHGHPIHEPQLVVWVDAETNFVLNSNVVAPEMSADDGVTEALLLLMTGMDRPGSAMGAPIMPMMNTDTLRGLPETIIVTDAALVPALEARFAPLGVAIEQHDALPQLDDLLDEILHSMGFSPTGEPPPPFTWDIPRAQVAPLFVAASKLWNVAPWEVLSDYPTLTIELGAAGPTPEVTTMHAAILGAGEELYGVACYYSHEAYVAMLKQSLTLDRDRDRAKATIVEQMRTSGIPIQLLPPDMLDEMVEMALEQDPTLGIDQLAQDALTCFFEERDGLDQTYLEWLKAHNIAIPARQLVPSFMRTMPGNVDDTRPPNSRESRALALTLEAITQFTARFRATLEGPLTIGVPLELTTTIDKQSITVRYTPEEPNALLQSTLPPEALTTVYRLRVALEWVEDVWRRIEIRGDQTLDDLHLAIQSAFGWDNDHMYAFFLSGKAWDPKTEYEGNPLGDGNAGITPIFTLNLRARKKFLYIFDYGDDLRHRITVEAVVKQGVAAEADYPRIIEAHGEAPPQYPYAEEEEDAEDEASEDGARDDHS